VAERNETVSTQDAKRTEAELPASLYLELLKRILMRDGFGQSYHPVAFGGRASRFLRPLADTLLTRRGLSLMRRAHEESVSDGRGLSIEAETMVGRKRLDNLQACVTDVIRSQVPGDLIETGVWRGGATIFMRAVLKAHGDDERNVWVADSFQGLPAPNAEKYPSDAGDRHWESKTLAVSIDEVRQNFERYDLLDDHVRFLPGWFSDTLPSAPIDRLAVLRLDGDMYESTIDALNALYPKVSVGGYVIVDDYGAVEGCRRAVDDYRRDHGIEDPMETIDWTGSFWRKTSDSEPHCAS
jgi:O-methyltransferase